MDHLLRSIFECSKNKLWNHYRLPELDAKECLGRGFQLGKEIHSTKHHAILLAAREGKVFALKVTTKTAVLAQRLATESKIQPSPYLLTYVERFETRSRIVSVYPYMEKRSLDKCPQEILRGSFISISLDICRGIEALHQQNLVHRDIKLQNVLFDQKCKLIDFEFCIPVGDPIDAIGTPNYLAPENFLTKNLKASCSLDIWSLGVVFYKILTEKLPFDGLDLQDLIPKIKAQPIDFSIVPEPYRPLISKMLERDPIKRIVIGDVIQALKSLRYPPFRTNVDKKV